MHGGKDYWTARALLDAEIDVNNPSPEHMEQLVEVIRIAPENILRQTDKVPKTFFMSMYGVQNIKKMVENYARNYKGDFVFMHEMCAAATLHDTLTPKQAAATLNVMISDFRKQRIIKSKFSPDPPGYPPPPVLPDRRPDGPETDEEKRARWEEEGRKSRFSVNRSRTELD